jgi:hypothetical protein
VPAQSGLGFSGIAAIQIPDDGLTGEVLTKTTDANYDYDWAAGGGGGGGQTPWLSDIDAAQFALLNLGRFELTALSGVEAFRIDGGGFVNQHLGLFKVSNGSGGIEISTYASGTAVHTICNWSGRWVMDTVNSGGVAHGCRGNVGGSASRSCHDFSADAGAAGAFRSVVGVLANASSVLQQWFQAGPVEVARVDYDGTIVSNGLPVLTQPQVLARSLGA